MSSKNQASRTLQSIIGPESSVEEFFEQVWQKECKVYRRRAYATTTTRSNEEECTTANESPLTHLVDNAWICLLSLLQQARGRFDESNDDTSTTMVPILFSQGQSVSPEPYTHNLFHAYLDGCSVVINHADWTGGEIAKVCLDLQRSFPHAYANTYLTPPLSQAVPPHADDRDVFVIQLFGRKEWKVYKEIPIPYPYSNEQVGKSNLKVSPRILEGPCFVDTILAPGDVLYMPRGLVHEAHTLSNECSFHVTIAIPTQDWTLTGAVTSATQLSLSQVLENRMALPLSLFVENDSPSNNIHANVELLQEQLEKAMNQIRQEITVDSILNEIRVKTRTHNERALPKRMAAICQMQQQQNDNTTTTTSNEVIIGMEAATRVSLDTMVRACTEKEKAQIVLQEPRGLNVREDTADALLGVLQKLKADPNCCYKVSNLLSLLNDTNEKGGATIDTDKICDLTLLSFARCCVELGGMTIVR